MNFKDQYHHPMWQKKRLECLEAAEYQCQMCFDKDSALSVHHKRYIKDRKVWEYDISELEVLCDTCHQQAQADKDLMYEALTKFPCEAISEIVALIAGYSSSVYGPAGGLPSGRTFLENCASLNPLSFESGRLAGIERNQMAHNRIAK